MQQTFDMKTPVLFLMFNRPHKAIQVFEKIRQVRPPKLFLVVDGARADRPGEAEKVQQCCAFQDMVDWDCDLKVNFAETNMGCQNRISSGITWAFEHVDELIILEDDCIPDLSFFRFCQELLEKYRDDNRVFSIGGNNFDEYEPFDESYAFANHFECWGWATWKRAWKFFDITMKQWPLLKNNKYMENIFHGNKIINLSDEFQKAYDEQINTWAYRYWISCLANHGLHIVSRVNLMRNTGFGSDGTHIAYPIINHMFMDEAMDFPLVHPEIMSPIDRLFVPPNLPPEEVNRILSEYDADFRKLLNSERYRDVLTLYKKVLRERITDIQLTMYHLSFAYYAALAYFNLGDLEHAEALTDIILACAPQNVDLLLFRIQIFLRQGAFDKIQRAVETLNTLNPADFTPQQTATLTEILDSIETNSR